jgi:gamma-glutamyltranspeptidase/glutathione hydrolase
MSAHRAAVFDHHPRALVALVVTALFAAAPACANPPAETIGVPPGPGQGNSPSWAGKAFRQGVVTAANPYGAEAGAQILEAGGNAIDAAVAIAYALNVVEPQSAGVGGGGFMLIHLAKSKRTFAIDTREKAPAGATRTMFVGVPSVTLQGVAVGVPGMVRGTAHAVEQYGKLSLAKVIAPAIKLADDGFAATPRYSAASCNSRAQNSPEAAAYFCPGGVPPAVGSLVTNKPLAATLRAIAEKGPDCFYVYDPARGCEIAKGIVEGQKWNRPQAPNGKGGTMTFADLENYNAVERVPVEATYRGYTIRGMTSPSSGPLTVLYMLKILEAFPIGDASQGYGFGSLLTVNVMAEAMRVAFADRAVWMGDTDFRHVPAKGLLDPTYIAGRRALITPGSRMTPNPVAADPRPYDMAGIAPATRLAVADPVTGPGETTTHFSVVDKEGNMVSYTNTIESSHGIGVFAGYTEADGTFRNFGFLLNNELTDFNTAPSTNPFTGDIGTNDVEPNKRPRSSMAPVIVIAPNGEPIAAFGSPGGSTIINSVLNIAMNLIDHKMTVQDAIDAPRVSVTSAASTVALENGFPQGTIAGLAGLGYSVATNQEIGAVQAVVVDAHTGKQYGGADSRREGTVIGLPR